MAKSMAGHDQRPTELFEDLTIQWVRQTTAYMRSVRLYQEHVGRGRAHRPRSFGQAARPDPTRRPARLPTPDVPNIVALRPSPGLVAPAPAEQTGAEERCPLTARQLEIAELIAQGLTNGQIATRLVVSRGTVGNHIGHMLRRLGMHNRAQIAAWMIRRSQESGLS